MSQPLNTPLCPICGRPNDCAAAASGTFDVDCWCRGRKFPAELLATVPEPAREHACICRACVESFHAKHAGEDHTGGGQ